MIKFLIFLAILYLIYKFLFKKPKKINKHDDDGTIDTMIQCKSCHIYISKQDAILSNGGYFCSKECVV